MNRRIKFNAPRLLIAAGMLACAYHAALALPQTSGAGPTAAADNSEIPRDANSEASSPAIPPIYVAKRNPFAQRRFSLTNMTPSDSVRHSGIQPSDSDQPAGTDQSSSADQSSSVGQQSITDQTAAVNKGAGKPKHFAEDATQSDSNFPPWSLYSNQNFDPRVKPNGGLRLPLLFPNFSPVVPDYDRTIAATRNWSAKISLAEFGVYLDPLSAKFNEFRDVRNGAVAGVEAHYREGTSYLNVAGRELGRRDEDMNIEGGVAGKYVFSFMDTEVPHNYMFGAASLFSGVGTGNLTISDSIRTDIQNSTSITDADTKLAGYVSQQGQSVNLDLDREKRGADITILRTYPWVIKLGATEESRNGERPWSASFGFADFVEIPWAVHYAQDDFHINAEWAKPESRIYFNAGFRANLFQDRVPSETFSNPFRIKDSADLTGSYDGGPATGRLALYPSNQSYEPSAVLVVKELPWDSTLSATLSAAFGYQNEPLLPFSTNTSDTVFNMVGAAFNATDPAALPRQTAEASVNSESLQLRWTAHPSDHLHLNTEYRVFRNDVTTPRFVFADFVREDQDVRTPTNQCTEPCSANFTFSSLPIGYTRQTATITANYDFGHDNQLGLTYTFENWDRRYREVKYMDDNRIRLTYDSKAKKWLDFKGWYEHTIRTASSYHFNEWHMAEGDGDEYTALPMLHKFDEAPYHKDDIQAMATFTLGSSMSISTHGLFGKTSFDGQTFGVLDNSHQSYGVDYSYDASNWLSFFADYSFEKFHTRLHDRTFTPGDACDPYTNAPGYASACNWFGVPEDTYNTAGVGVDAYLIPKRFHWTVSYSFSKSHGTQSYSGGGGVDNPFVPTNFNNVDSATYNTIDQELEYKFTKTIALDAGYLYELWLDKDYNYDGFNYVNQFSAFNFLPITGTNLLMGGLLPPEYHANVAYFRLKFGF
jgi:hypothetical protein